MCVSGYGFMALSSPTLAQVLGCVCSCARSACTRSVLPAVCGVRGCAWVLVLAAPRHCWWGFWGVLCLCARSACTPPILAGVCGLGVSVRNLAFSPPVLTGVVARVCLCARSACTPPFLAQVCGVCVCVFGYGFQLRPAFPGWESLGVRVCVRSPPVPCESWLRFVVCALGFRFGLSPRLSSLGCWGMCVFVRAPPAARRSWLGFNAWVCACIQALALPRHSWLWCWGLCVGVRAPHAFANPGLGLLCVGWVLPGTFSHAVVRCGLGALPGFAVPVAVVA